MADLQTLTFSIPMATRFRGIDVREGMLVAGRAGWGEFAPFAGYGDAQCIPWWRTAFEAAVLGFPKPLRDNVPVNTTVPAVGPDQARVMVAASGCRTAKVKVAEPGQLLADDIARVEAVRDALGPDGAIRVDANAGWDLDAALVAVPALDRAAATGGGAGLEYVEQPCAAVEDLAVVRRRTDVRVAADESIRLAQYPLAVVRAEAADVAVLKVAPLGGVRAALLLAERLGIPVVVSSAVDTSVGLAAGVALAAALPELPFACGLGTATLLSGDVTTDPLLPVGGALPVRTVVPDARVLSGVTADWETRRAWLRRSTRVRRAAGELLDLVE